MPPMDLKKPPISDLLLVGRLVILRTAFGFTLKSIGLVGNDICGIKLGPLLMLLTAQTLSGGVGLAGGVGDVIFMMLRFCSQLRLVRLSSRGGPEFDSTG